MEKAGLLTRTGEQGNAYLPARSLSSIEVSELFGAVRGAHETGHINVNRLVVEAPIEKLAGEFDELEMRAMQGYTLEKLVREADSLEQEHAPVELYPSEKKD